MPLAAPSVLTPTLFRQLLRMFRDSDRFPDVTVQNYLNQAAQDLNPAWGAPGTVSPTLALSSLDYGVLYYTAHYLALDDRDASAAALGAMPGELAPPTSSKSVGGVSVSKDTGSVTHAAEGAKFWNQTRFGVEFWRRANMIGAGGIQTGAGEFLPPIMQLTDAQGQPVQGVDAFWGLYL